MNNTTRDIRAGELTAGLHTVVNLGPVIGVRAEGAFVHVEVQRRIWSPARGVMEEASEMLFLHSTDEVVVADIEQRGGAMRANELVDGDTVWRGEDAYVLARVFTDPTGLVGAIDIHGRTHKWLPTDEVEVEVDDDDDD